jgi:hypothetical protein
MPPLDDAHIVSAVLPWNVAHVILLCSAVGSLHAGCSTARRLETCHERHGTRTQLACPRLGTHGEHVVRQTDPDARGGPAQRCMLVL